MVEHWFVAPDIWVQFPVVAQKTIAIQIDDCFIFYVELAK